MVESAAKTKGVYLLPGFGDRVIAGFSGREFPSERRKDFLREIDIPAKALTLVKQVHSANLIQVTASERPAKTSCADGLLSADPGIALGILTADCFPVFFYDPVHSVACMIHAGWRGISHGIVRKCVQALRYNFASHPGDVAAAIGPGIRGCCFEVDEEFQGIFPEFYLPLPEGPQGKGKVDLAAAIRRELASEGLPESGIFDTGFCTVCQNDRFFSYRREKKTKERMLSVIYMRP